MTAKSAQTVASDVANIASQIARVRESNVQHADAVAAITGALADGRTQQLSQARVEKA